MRNKIANWGNYPTIDSEEHSFKFMEELKQIVSETDKFIPRGNGRCYGDASLSFETVSTLKYNRILSFDSQNGVLECQSGLTLDKILEFIVPCGWFLPVTPGTKFITIGGAIASDVHGKNHHVDGCFSRHVIEIDVMLSTGEVKTCSHTSTPELFHATCGGMGLTGVITRAKFSLKKIQTSFIRQKQIKASNLEEVLYLFDKYSEYTYSVAWIDCLKKGKQSGRSIMILGEHAELNELPNKLRKNPLSVPNQTKFNFPIYLPSWILNKLTVRLFNWLYYHKNLKHTIDNIVSYEPFFYPLDSIKSWNKGYGKRGFVQYQFVIPIENKNGLIEILEKIRQRGIGSFLAVLKIFGDDKSLIGFPIRGYTLALDIPVSADLWEFLDELDYIVINNGGRVYLSKDARMKPEILKKSYQHLAEFKEIIHKYNPNSKISSIQSERLEITK